MALTLLTGPVASGKSRLAAQLASRWQGPVEVIATAEGLDDEMSARIERHRSERPASWRVREEPIDLAGGFGALAEDAFALVDCLTLWTSNRLEAGDRPEEILDQARATAAVAAARHAPTVVVTNEVGWGIVPVNDLARAYRDLLGGVNGAFADRAERVWLVVAGRVMPLLRPDHADLVAGPQMSADPGSSA